MSPGSVRDRSRIPLLGIERIECDPDETSAGNTTTVPSVTLPSPGSIRLPRLMFSCLSSRSSPSERCRSRSLPGDGRDQYVEAASGVVVINVAACTRST